MHVKKKKEQLKENERLKIPHHFSSLLINLLEWIVVHIQTDISPYFAEGCVSAYLFSVKKTRTQTWERRNHFPLYPRCRYFLIKVISSWPSRPGFVALSIKKYIRQWEMQ